MAQGRKEAQRAAVFVARSGHPLEILRWNGQDLPWHMRERSQG